MPTSCKQEKQQQQLTMERLTKRFVNSAKNMKMRCASQPQRTLTSSRNVCAVHQQDCVSGVAHRGCTLHSQLKGPAKVHASSSPLGARCLSSMATTTNSHTAQAAVGVMHSKYA